MFLQGGPSAFRNGAQSPAMNGLGRLVGTLLVAVAACSPTPSSPPAATGIIEPTLTAGPSKPAPAATTVPTPSPVQALGPLADGIPTTIDGANVYVAAAAEQHIKGSTNDEPFLVGGWFHQGRPTVFCPAYRYGTRWGCDAWIWLYPDAAATGGRTIYPSDPPNLTDTDLYGATRAVVLRVHTHDPACPSDLEGCDLLPVEEALVWLGEAQP